MKKYGGFITFALFAAAMLFFSMAARADQTENGILYTVEGDHIEIYRYIGTDPNLEIPEEIDGLPVTDMGLSPFSNNDVIETVKLPSTMTYIVDWGFSFCANLREVELSDGMVRIGFRAFSDCPKLEKIILPDSVDYIGNSAFSYCRSLKSIYLPKSLTYIGSSSFDGCDSLEEVIFPEKFDVLTFASINADVGKVKSIKKVTVPENNPDWKSVDGVLFTADGSQIMWYPAGKEGNEYTIPAGVKEIYSWCFRYAEGLKTVRISPGVSSVEWAAFDSCYGLTDLYIPSSVKRIGGNAFNGCYNLRNVYYSGSEADWRNIDIDDYNNDYIVNAQKTFYSASDPVLVSASAVEENEAITVNIEAYDVPLTAELIVAGYGDRGVVSMAWALNGKATLAKEGVKSIRVFCWDKLEGLLPLCKAVDAPLIRKSAFVGVTATQTPEPKNPPANLIDGDKKTFWACNGQGSITADLGEVKTLRKLCVFLNEYADNRTLDITVEVSDDGSSFTTVSSERYGGGTGYSREISLNTPARYVRIGCNGNSVSNWASVAELEAYTE